MRVVLADWFFTLPAVILQPLIGTWLMLEARCPWQDLWLRLSTL